MVMVFSATFNNISAMSWQSVLLVEENRSTRPGENHRPAASHLKRNVISTPSKCVVAMRHTLWFQIRNVQIGVVFPNGELNSFR
jgi:hypothetical protein